jgi:hypothetical protein
VPRDCLPTENSRRRKYLGCRFILKFPNAFLLQSVDNRILLRCGRDKMQELALTFDERDEEVGGVRAIVSALQMRLC